MMVKSSMMKLMLFMLKTQPNLLQLVAKTLNYLLLSISDIISDIQVLSSTTGFMNFSLKQ